MRKTVGVLLSSLLVSSTILTGTAFGTDIPKSLEMNVHDSVFTDLGNHWAKQTVEKWYSRGIVQGVSKQAFAPDRTLTRAEWVTLLNRTFQLTHQNVDAPIDVQENSWYASDVKVALTAGYIGLGEDGSFKANRALTREEAAVTLSNLLKLKQMQPNTYSFFDFKATNAVNGAAVYAAVEAGLLKGYTDGSFRPNQSLTRAEAAVLIDRATQVYGLWIGETGQYGSTNMAKVNQQKGSVIVNAPGSVTLQNVNVEHDLIIGKNVGENNVTLKNVTVHGHTYVYGGGKNSIHIEDSHLAGVTVDKKEGTVRIAAQGNTTIQELVVHTAAIVETEQGSSIDTVQLSNELPDYSEVQLAGYFHKVNVQARNLTLNIPSGSISELTLEKEAGGAILNTGSESHLLSLLLNSVAKVTGTGKVDQAVINARDITFDQLPTAFKVGQNIPTDTKVTVNGQQVPLQPNASVSSVEPPAVSVPGVSPSGGPVMPVLSPSPVPDPLWEQKLEIALQDKAVALGEGIYFTSSVNGIAYLSSTAMPAYNLPALNVGVKAGDVLSQEVVAGQPAFFSTANLRNVSFPENYTFNVTVYQTGTPRYTVSEVQVLDDSKRLTSQPVQIHYGDTPEYFSFEYNRILRLAPGKSLNEIIEIKLKDEKQFKAFDVAQGTVELVGGTVYVYLEQAPLGREFYLKLRTGSVMSSDGHRNKEVISGPLKSFIPIHLISHGAQTSATVKKGEDIEFSIDYPGTVYLSPSSLIGSKEDYDKTAEQGIVKKVVVSEAQAKKPLKISTQGLSTGRYMLHVWNGHNILIEIVD